MLIHTYWSKLKIKSRQMATAAAVLDGYSPEQQARMLTRLVSVILFTSLVISPIWILLSPDFIAARYISLGLVVALCVTYILSRVGQINAASLLLSLTLIALIFATFFTAPGTITERMLTLNFLILVVMVTSLFIPRLTLIVAALSLAAIGGFFFIPGAPPTVTFAYLVFFLSIISFGAAYNQLSGKYKRQLLESEERYRSVVTAMSEGVVLMSRDGAIETFNKATEQILGLTEDQMRGRNVLDPTWQAVHEDGTPFLG